jgi:nitroreductase/NAD-dependent dihydropyrimidine dehydrogenase PreA subunit
MEKTLPRIDTAACIGCGACARLCPSGVLSCDGETARVVADGCIGCGHCAALCPAGAVTLDGGDDWAESFATVSPAGKVFAPGTFSADVLIDLLRSRRSCRRYTPEPVPGPVLDDLVRAAVTAPSGTNSQAWTFTILPTRQAVLQLGEAVAGFFRRINRLAANALVRKSYALLGRSELENYYREHYRAVASALKKWDRDRTDLLFHGAAAVIVVGSLPGASCPGEDALLATQNMLLAGHAMGLGSCLIGYAVEAIRHDRRVRAAAGLPARETVHAVVALGWPDVVFLRHTGRRRPVVRYRTA